MEIGKDLAASWKRVRKTRVKKTGMTELLQAFDRELRGYDRERRIEEICRESNWEARQGGQCADFADCLKRLDKLSVAHARDWTPEEKRFLVALREALGRESEAWGKQPVSARMKQIGAVGVLRELALPMKTARDATTQSSRCQADLRNSLRDADKAFASGMGESGYRGYLQTLGTAIDTLEPALKAQERALQALAERIAANRDIAPSEATALLAEVRDATRSGQALLQSGRQRRDELSAALTRFVAGQAEVRRTLVEPRDPLERQLKAACAAVEPLDALRTKLSFQRGVRPDAAALDAFRVLAGRVAAARRGLDDCARAVATFASAVMAADQRDLGAMLPGQRSPFVVAAKKDLLAWTQRRSEATARLKGLEDFVALWTGLLPA